MTRDEKKAWNSTDPWSAGNVGCRSRDEGNFSSALRVQGPTGVICVSFALFCVIPLGELIWQPGEGCYYYTSDTQICIITSYDGNSSLSNDAIWIEQQAETWLMTGN